MNVKKKVEALKESFRRTPHATALVFAGVLCAGGVASLAFFSVPIFAPVAYESDNSDSGAAVSAPEEKPRPYVAEHLPTPSPLRAIYMTSWVAGTPAWRASLVRMIEETELNAIVIDIKDYSGRVAFPISDPDLVKIGAAENRIADVKEFIQTLHDKNIYVIGRITVFQDPYLARVKPEWAVKKESATSTLWADDKGLHYIDPGMRNAWDYTVAIARESYEHGFDELNFDYIRFPSDGDMRDIYYPASEARVLADPDYGKAKVVRSFFAYLHRTLTDPAFYPSNEYRTVPSVPVLSADLFGMTTTNTDDLNIGQVLEYAEPYFDYLAPMVYPSHYPMRFIEIEQPARWPYRVVRYSMDRGVERLIAASSTPSKLRPWLQDFDLGAIYDAEMVRKQIQATYDSGLDSWMLWDPANTYTRDALLPAQ